MGRPKKKDDGMRPIGLPPALTERLRAASLIYNNKHEPLTYTGAKDKDMKGERIQLFSSDNEIAIYYIRRALIRANIIKGLDEFMFETPKFENVPPMIEENLTRLVVRIPKPLQPYVQEFTDNGAFQSEGFAVRFLIQHELKRDGLLKATGTALQTLVNR